MLNKILSYFRLWGEKEDFDELHEKVLADSKYQGTNLWILILAILVASVGLNIDSVPVVIGAMLISPLMGPINGMGFGIATNDKVMLRTALSNMAFAVVASIVASTLYFLITPISAASSQLLSRTNPTVYDGIIAFFGGMAGMLALGSRMKGNVIPGVAIATALMPPLCTAGFAIATWQMNFLWGSLYLFAINTVCMVVAGIIIAQIVKFPIRRDITDKEKIHINTIVTVIVIVTIVPSIFLAYRLLQQEEFKSNATQFIEEVRFMPNSYLIQNDVNARKSEIKLVYAGLAMTEEEKHTIRENARKMSLAKAKIDIKEGFSFGSLLENDPKATNNHHIDNLNAIIKQAEHQRDSLANIPKVGQNMLSELSSFYPGVEACSYSETINYNRTDSLTAPQHIVVIHSCDTLEEEEKAKIRKWVINRLGKENIRVYFEEEKHEK